MGDYMKTFKIIIFSGITLLASLALFGQQVSQERDTSGSSSGSVSNPVSTPSAPQSIPQASTSGNPSYSSYNSISSSRDFQPAALSNGGASSGGYAGYQYINPRTSFWSYDSYYRSMQLFDFLLFNYGNAFGNRYFSRFYINNEPIVNTKVAQYAMRIPMYNAKKLLTVADQLQQIRSKYASGQKSGSLLQDPEFKSFLLQAKELARTIQKYPALEYLEVRKATDLTGKLAQKDFASCLDQMDGYIRMLQNQFSDMVDAESPALISIQQLSQPSFLSLAKGIEKLAAQLEKTKT